MDILVIGKEVEVHDLVIELELLDNRVVHLNSLTDLISLKEDEIFDVIILERELCYQLPRDELEKIRFLRGRGYKVPVVVFGATIAEESNYREKGYSTIISKSHATKEVEEFLTAVLKGEVFP
ncbi:MAG: hypothetical protein N3G21_06605 [Candidatus Hydrogenedentes bacterium]|nr:hypothetical protein [Candidatus Hydrogenedentota bacterium]